MMYIQSSKGMKSYHFLLKQQKVIQTLVFLVIRDHMQNFVRYYHEQMHQMYDGYAGNERRKWGIENYGLCILLAWTNEIIQHGAGWYPK